MNPKWSFSVITIAVLTTARRGGMSGVVRVTIGAPRVALRSNHIRAKRLMRMEFFCRSLACCYESSVSDRPSLGIQVWLADCARAYRRLVRAGDVLPSLRLRSTGAGESEQPSCRFQLREMR